MQHIHIIFKFLFLFFLALSPLQAADVTQNITLSSGNNTASTQNLSNGKDCIIWTASIAGDVTRIQLDTGNKKVKLKFSTIGCGDSNILDDDSIKNNGYRDISNVGVPITLAANDKLYMEFDKNDEDGVAKLILTFAGENTPPVADAGDDQDVATGSSVTLDGSGSSDADNDPLEYAWTITTLPSGSAATLSGSTTDSPTFTADVDGIYEISLIVNDGTIDSAPDSVIITASTGNIAPIANAGSDRTVVTGETVTLDGSGSSDVDNDPLTYTWTMTTRPNNSSAVLSDSDTVSPTFTADVDGIYEISLIVNDGTINSATHSVIITASTPTNDFTNYFTEVQCGPLNTLDPGSIELSSSVTVRGTTNGELITPSFVGTETGSCDGQPCSATGTGVDPIAFTVDYGNDSNNDLIISSTTSRSNVDEDYNFIEIKANTTLTDVRLRAYDKFIADGYTLNISGNVVIQSNGDVELKMNTINFLTSDSTLTVLTNGAVTFGSALVVTPSDHPTTNFQVLAKGDVSGTGSNSSLRALIYSGGTVTIGSDSTIYGSVTAQNIITGSDSYIDASENEGCTQGGTSVDGPFFVDAVDISYSDATYTDANGPDIQTKVSAQADYNFDAVYLGSDTTGVENYYSNNKLQLTVQVTLTNSDCSEEYLWDDTGSYEPVGVAEIEPGTSSASMNEAVKMPSLVGKDMRLMLKAIDWYAIFDTFDVSNACFNSNTTGSLCGVMSCLSSATQAEIAFPVNTDKPDKNANNRRIMGTCYGLTVDTQGTPDDETDDTVSGSIPSDSPCQTNNYTGSCGGDKSDINPDKYQHKYGCLSCILDTDLEGVGCSVDHFAVRPNSLNLGMSHLDYPNLLRAGENYNVSLTAYDAANVVSTDYNVTDHNWAYDLDANSTKYFRDGTVNTADLLHGTADINTSVTAYSVAGKSRSDVSVGTAQEVIPVSYNDVGKVNLVIYDKIWAAIDNDDTPMDCNSTTHTYICGDANVTFIPHHFAFEELNITNQAGPNSDFTYIADDRGMPVNITAPIRSPMAARVHTQIQALSKAGTLTQNFREDSNGYTYYENNISVALSINVPSPSVNGYPYPPDENTSNISDKRIGFGRAGLDTNGTRNILWDESTYPLEFNFERNMNEPGKPFDVNGSSLSISLLSHYIDPDDTTNTADITGSRIGDSNTSTCIAPPTGSCVQQNAEQNATFYFGRAVPSKQYFYDDVTDSDEETPIYVYVYCDPTSTQCTDYNIPISAQTNDYDWWFSLQHDMSQDYGDIELTVGNITPSGTATVTTAPSVTINAGADGKDDNVVVTATSSAPRPMTVNIDLVTDDSATDYTHPWLIYNPDSNTVPTPFYRVRFIGSGVSGWMGKGKTGHVIEDDVNAKKTKRLEW